MAYSESQLARHSLFGERQFVQQIADATSIAPSIVGLGCEALSVAGALPCAASENADALAMDGAMILMALGSRQQQRDSIVRVLGRLRDMEHQLVVGPSKPTLGRDASRGAPDALFVHGVADVIKRAWQISAPNGGGADEIAVNMLWGERGLVLYGVIDDLTNRRKHIYSTATLPAPHEIGTEWDFVELPTVGGQMFSAPSILRYARLLKNSAAGTAAGLEAMT